MEFSIDYSKSSFLKNCFIFFCQGYHKNYQQAKHFYPKIFSSLWRSLEGGEPGAVINVIFEDNDFGRYE